MKYSLYTTNNISPRGWLKRQLEIQGESLSGNLHKIWPDIRDSAWIGGEREGWERVPYWLDGFIPLAHLLKDEEMIVTAKKYVDAIIAGQKEDGWICPCSDEERSTYNTWAILLISKTLYTYYQCTGDERIPDVLYRVMKNYLELLKNGTVELFTWGKFRWFEGFIALNFLYDIYKEEWIRELAKILRDQGADYLAVSDMWKRPMNKWQMETHIVNITMMLKSEAVSADLLGEEYTDYAEKVHSILTEYNGTAVGLYTGDECLSGISPIQGTELCSVVEQMYSLELLYAYTGDRKWAERLEQIALNALPATFTDDMWAHQYLQMANQICCKTFEGKPIFRTNGHQAHIFGLEPIFGCCTSNLSQGYPKLALSTFMKDGNNVICALPLPSSLEDDGVKITLDTEYPFKNTFKYTVETSRDFKFTVRIPSFAKNLTVDGKAVNSADLSFDFAAGENREISVSFETVPYFESRPNGLNTVKCGSLVYALPIKYTAVMSEYENNGVVRKFPYCDYELLPESDWNYAFSSDALEVCEGEISNFPYSSEKPPVTIKAKLRKIDWGYEDGYDTVCAKIPESTVPTSEEETIALYPYGCTRLRVTELPFATEN